MAYAPANYSPSWAEWSIIAFGPYTHANLDAGNYTRTNQILIGTPISYAGDGLAVSPSNDLIERGKQLFVTKGCATCHGLDTAGKTFQMDNNSTTIPSLSWSDLSQMYSTDSSRGTVEQQFVIAVTKGLDESGDEPNPMMPGWSFLSQEQVDSLIQYIQATFK